MNADRTVIQRLLTAYEKGRDVDLRSTLKHELIPVQVSHAEMEGTLRTGNRSILADCLIDGIPCIGDFILYLYPPANRIIDCQAPVMSICKPDKATTFGDLADKFCNSVLRMGHSHQCIDVVFNRCTQSSIKGETRNRRTKGCKPIRRLVELSLLY